MSILDETFVILNFRKNNSKLGLGPTQNFSEKIVKNCSKVFRFLKFDKNRSYIDLESKRQFFFTRSAV